MSTTEFLMYFVMILAVIASIVYGILMMVHTFWTKFWKTDAAKIQAQPGTAHMRSSQNHHKIVAAYLEAYGNTEFASRTSPYKFFPATLLREVLEKSFEIELAHSECDLSGKYCYNIYKLTDNKKRVIFVAGEEATQYAKDAKTRNIFNFVEDSGMDITDFYTSENDIKIVSDLEIICPVAANEIYEDLTKILEVIEIERVDYMDVDNTSNASVYRLNDGMNPLYRVWMKVRPMKQEHVNALYAPIKCKLGTEQVAIKAFDAKKIAVDSLKQGENLYINGTFGTGKSSFATLIQHDLSMSKDCRVIIIPAEQFAELYQSGRSQKLVNALAPDPTSESAVRNIIFIDEAELLLKPQNANAVAMLRQMLDGDMKQQMNLAVCLVFNAEPSNFDSGIFRKGRVQLEYTINPLEAEQAKKAVNVLRAAMPQKIFSADKFNQVLRVVNTLPNGIKYAGINEITLADVVDCFHRKSYQAAILESLRAAGKDVKQPNTIKGIPAPQESRLVGIPRAK